MRAFTVLLIIGFSASPAALAQDNLPDQAAGDASASAKSAPDGPPVEPAPQVSDHQDDRRDQVMFSDETERFKPLVSKLTRNVIMDQKDIFTSPFRMSRRQSPIWIGFAAATGVLIATDRWTSKELPNTSDQLAVSRKFSQIGAAYTVLPICAGLYITGAFADNPKAREAGILGGQAALDALIVVAVLKAVTQRPRPPDGNGNGSFFTGGDSFPSGHAAMSFAMASVLAQEYRKSVVGPIAVYTLAGVISLSRVTGQRHFPSDVLAGAGMGYFIGRYVFRTHVDHSIHRRPPSKLGALTPRLRPQFDPSTRMYAVGLTWN